MGPRKSGRKEFERGEKGQGKEKEKGSPPNETWENVDTRRTRRKSLALTGHVAMAIANLARIADTLTTDLRQERKGKMRWSF
jgi:hypothetical protein